MYEALKVVGVGWSRMSERSWDPELRYGALFIWIRLVLTLKGVPACPSVINLQQSEKLVAKQMDDILCYNVNKLHLVSSDFSRKQVKYQE